MESGIYERFLNDRAVATSDIIKVIHHHASPEILDYVWKTHYPGLIPDQIVIAEELKGNVIDLEEHDLVVVNLDHTDINHTACLNVSSIDLVVARDAV